MSLGYKICYCVSWPVFKLRYNMKFEGRDNLIDGAAVVCANHSSMADPFLVAYAMTIKYQIHFMAKAELMRLPVIGWILKNIGIFGVDRGRSDVTAIKTSLKLLRNGEKLGIFPEGTRIRENEASDAKTGAIMLAVRTGSPVVPVYVPVKKKFGQVTVRVGPAYYPQSESARATTEDYRRMAAELMEKIRALEPR